MKLVNVIFKINIESGKPKLKIIRIQDDYPKDLKKDEMVESGIYMNCQARKHSSDVIDYGRCSACGNK